MVETVVSSVLDELNEMRSKALSRRSRLLIRLAIYVLIFAVSIPLTMEVLFRYKEGTRDEEL